MQESNVDGLAKSRFMPYPVIREVRFHANPESRKGADSDFLRLHHNWLTLKGFYEWEQPVPPGEKRFEKKRRNLWYILRCYLVKKIDSIKLLKWAKKQSWKGMWMPDSEREYNIFLGEFSWSSAFKDRENEYFSRLGW